MISLYTLFFFAVAHRINRCCFTGGQVVGHFSPQFTPQRQWSSTSLPLYPPSVHLEGSTTDEKVRLNIKQGLEKKPTKYKASDSVIKRRHFQILTWVVSALCLCAIITTYAISRIGLYQT
jgi:hypothetical protein